jgi:hypothetical protein
MQVWVYQFYASVQHSGIENLAIQFAEDVYPEHLDTKGYNAIGLYSTANCWVSGVRIFNADNGIHVSQSDFVTIQHVVLSVTKPRWTEDTYPDNGHHALWLVRAGDVLVFAFNIKNQFMHDLSVDGFAERSVFSSGSGVNLNIDCHRGGPHNHLFSNINCGSCGRPFLSGGDTGRGAHAGGMGMATWSLLHTAPVGPLPGAALPTPCSPFTTWRPACFALTPYRRGQCYILERFWDEQLRHHAATAA